MWLILVVAMNEPVPWQRRCNPSPAAYAENQTLIILWRRDVTTTVKSSLPISLLLRYSA